MLMFSMITLSMMIMFLNHPLSMGLILIMQTLTTAMIIGYMMSSFFFSYIIIIIMLSGTLVLFIYMASVASNEKFNMSFKLMLIPIITAIFMMQSKIYNYNNTMNESISLIKIFNTTTAQLTLIMIIYLLLTMIVVSNNAKTTEGPLRMKK
nr:NADH dehydrogenase subunit 6 [Deroploa parva]QVD38898.1 NADH dehydrogenase subunit 6 [Deroploa parva]